MDKKGDPLARVEQLVDIATRELRSEFIQAVPSLPMTDRMQEWRASRKILSVAHADQELVPAFQLDAAGQPLPIVGEVLAILGRDPERCDWDDALWFASDTGWLDGQRPIDCLHSDPAGVRRAAEQEVLRDID